MPQQISSREVQQYIAQFPPEVQGRLEQLRCLVSEIAADASEGIAYGMLAYKLKNKPLIYFGAFAKHIGVYALPTAHSHFAQPLQGYKQGKGSVQFPLKEELPLELIAELLRFRLAELG